MIPLVGFFLKNRELKPGLWKVQKNFGQASRIPEALTKTFFFLNVSDFLMNDKILFA